MTLIKCQGVYGKTKCNYVANATDRNWTGYPICNECFELQAQKEFGPDSKWFADGQLIERLQKAGKSDAEIQEARKKFHEEWDANIKNSTNE
jgi:hypothetical protein